MICLMSRLYRSFGAFTLLVLSLLFVNCATAQSKGSHPQPSIRNLPAKEFPDQNLPVLGEKFRPTTFTLTTSWIAGKDNKGFIRYQMEAFPINNIKIDMPVFIEALHKCDFTLELMDADKFIVRRISIPFHRAVSPSGSLSELNANDIDQMSVEDYKSINTYTVSWSCPKPPDN